MGQKIHPLGFRLGVTQKHRSQWFAKTNNYPGLVIEDNFLRKTILNKFSDAGIVQIEIERKLDQIKIEIKSAKPGIIINRDGNGLEVLRNELDQKVRKYRAQNFFTLPESAQISLHLTELANPDAEATFIAQFLVEQLEKRVAFRSAIKKSIKRAKRARVKGIKIQVSGRLNGAEIARSEWVREGRVPLQTLRADIDYSYCTAKTIYGLLGIKVWIFKGELLSPKTNS